jgi:multiple sugar transport system substrate-binding protein
MNIKPRFGSTLRRTAAVATVGLALAGILAGCSASASTSSSGTTGNAASITAALQKKSSITVWAWAPQMKTIVTSFEKKYPNVTVNLVNAGTSAAEYTKLQNAVKAGSGAPDVAQIEYYAIPQFAISNSLTDLSTLGMSSLKSKFTASTWGSVNVNGGLYGLPQDSGPMALFYNKTVFDKYGLTVPTTWDQYIADAKKLHAANPNEYMSNDVGDAGFTDSMIWEAGGHPYTISNSGKDVTINLQDAGSKQFANTWNPLVQGGLMAPIASWSNEWYQGLANGTIASLAMGAWMPSDLESSVASGSGQWRVAPLPTFEAGKPADAENGGSADSVMKQSKNPLVAAGFVQYMNAQQGAQISIQSGSFPSTTADLSSSSFLNQTPAYFGGQKINQVLAQASKDVLPGWSYLPFQVYSNSIYGDTVGQAYANKTDLNAGLQAWQKASASYGTQQGFTVTSK